MTYPKNISVRILPVFIFCSFLTSCELLEILAGPSPNGVVVNSLELDAWWRGNLVGTGVIEGSITNNHYRDVSGITVRAKVYNKSGYLVETSDYNLYVTITSNGGVATFKEYLSTPKRDIGSVDIFIVSASD